MQGEESVLQLAVSAGLKGETRTYFCLQYSLSSTSALSIPPRSLLTLLAVMVN